MRRYTSSHFLFLGQVGFVQLHFRRQRQVLGSPLGNTTRSQITILSSHITSLFCLCLTTNTLSVGSGSGVTAADITSQQRRSSEVLKP